jgi:exodeoxyribonuclease VII small subunit
VDFLLIQSSKKANGQRLIAKNMSYKEAIAEIEKILKSLREEQNSIDTLSERVARATELIALCREKLRKAENDVNKVLEE